MSPLTEPTRLTLAKGQPVPNDPNFAFNSLLLHGNGTNGSTVITDSSGSPKAVAAVGNAQISTAIADPFNNSTGVIAFDGTGDGVNVADRPDLRLGDGNFTVEGWVYWNSYTGFRDLFEKGYDSSGGILVETGNGTGRFIVYVSGVPLFTESTAPSTGQWIHYALVRSSGVVTLYRNGTSTGSANNNTNLNSTASVGIGNYSATGQYSINGYIDEFRITKGVARYTSNFTPPTLPFPDF